MRQPKRRAERYSRKAYDFRRAIGSANYLTSVAGGGLTLPRTGLIFYAKAPGMVDTVGLLTSRSQVDESIADIFFDGETARSDTDRYTLALASPLLNYERMMGRTGEIAVYSKTTPQATLNKARSAVRCLTFTGYSVFGDVRQFGLPIIPKWYADSINGSDSNDGLSRYTPLKTIAALRAKPIQDGDVIGLAANSYWREELDLVSVSDCMVVGYGVGKRPILDCADIADSESFSLIGGRTNTYQISWAHSVYQDHYVSVWEDGVRLTYVANEATCEATPGSFTAPYPAASPTTIKIHPTGSGNPATNGKVYEISKRNYGVFASRVSCVATRRNGHNDGSIVAVDFIANSIAIDGTKHNSSVRSGKILDSVSWKNDNSTRTLRTLFVSFISGGAGRSIRFLRCMAKSNYYASGTSGFYCHTAGDSSKYDEVEYEQCASHMCYSAFAVGNTKDVTSRACKATSVYSGFEFYCEKAVLIDPYLPSDATYTVGRGVNVTATISCEVDGLRGTVRNSNNGLVYASTPILDISHSVVHRISGGTGYTNGFLHYSAGEYRASYNIFSGIDQGHACTNAGSTPGVIDNNCFYPSTMDALISGVSYSSIAAYRLARPTLDVNSITSDPLFVDAANGNFALQAGSPCIAIGAGLERPNVEYLSMLSDEILDQW